MRHRGHAPSPPAGPEALGDQSLRHPQGVAAAAAACRRAVVVVVVVVVASSSAVAAPPAAPGVGRRGEPGPLRGEKGLRQRWGVREALQDGVHEAGVAEVLEAGALYFWWRWMKGKENERVRRVFFDFWVPWWSLFSPGFSLSLSLSPS